MAVMTTTNYRFVLAFVLGMSLGVTVTLMGQYGIRSSQLALQPIWTDDDVVTSSVGQKLSSPSLASTVPVPDEQWLASAEETPVNIARNDTSVAKLVTEVSHLDIVKYLSGNWTAAEAHAGEDELAQELFEKIRILCWVMTQPNNHESRAMTVKKTWGKRCNVLYFVSTEPVLNETTAIFPGTESRNILWGKTKVGFQYAYDNHFDDADWFVKADDDTYLIMENMRLMFLNKDPAVPEYYGCKFKPIVPQGYMSGGAGYVLSKEALRRFIEESLPNPDKCKQDNSGAEDAEMGFCLYNVGVATGDSRDQEGKDRFWPFVPQSHVNDKYDKTFWYWQYIYHMHESGVECCSDSSISFHYVDVNLMWALEFLIYHVHPFGIGPRLAGFNIKDDVEYYLDHRNATTIAKTKPTVAKPEIGQNNATDNVVIENRSLTPNTTSSTSNNATISNNNETKT